jgi:hypothetical protein
MANGIACNADLRPAQLRQYCQLDETSHALMRSAMNQMPAILLRRLRRGHITGF